MISIADNTWKLRNGLWNIALQKAFECLLVICTTWCGVPIICTTQECPIRAEREKGREGEIFVSPHWLFLLKLLQSGSGQTVICAIPRDHKPVTCCRGQARDAAYPAAGTRWSAQEWPSQDEPVRRAPGQTDWQKHIQGAFSLNLSRISSHSSKNNLSPTWHHVKDLRMRPWVTLSH